MIVALEHHHVGARLGRREGCGAAGGASPNHQHITAVIDRYVPAGLAVDPGPVAWGQGVLLGVEQVRAEEAVFRLNHALDLRRFWGRSGFFRHLEILDQSSLPPHGPEYDVRLFAYAATAGYCRKPLAC